MNKHLKWLATTLLLLLVACGGSDEPPPEPASGQTEQETAVTTTEEQSVESQADPAVTLPSVSDAPEKAAAGPAPTRFPAEKYADLEIVTLLPRDAIPAIDNPRFLSKEDADNFYDPDEFIIGVEFNGEARAYSVPFLSGHEIVNDTVGDVKISVTW